MAKRRSGSGNQLPKIGGLKGWIKAHRTDLSSGMLAEPERYAFIMYLRLKASHESILQPVGLQMVPLEPGQLVFGRLRAAEELRQSERQIRGHLDALQRAGKVSVKSTNKFSVITLLDWQLEQRDRDEHDQQNDHQNVSDTSSETPPTRPAEGHKQEVRKEKEEGIEKHDMSATNAEFFNRSGEHPGFEEFWDAFPHQKYETIHCAKDWWNKTRPPIHQVLKALSWQTGSAEYKKRYGLGRPQWYLRDQRWKIQIEELRKEITP